MRILTLLLAALLWAAPAHAHKASDAYLQLQVQGTEVHERLDIALRDLDRDLNLDADSDGRLSWGEVRTRWADFQALATRSVQLQANGLPCVAAPTGTPQLDEHSDGRYAVLTRRWTCPAAIGSLAVNYTLFADTDPSHRGILRLEHDGASRSAVFGPDTASQHFEISAHAAANAPQGLGGFLGEGVHHILIGTDHVLFLMSLLLPAVLTLRGRSGLKTRWAGSDSARTMALDVLRVVTAFTVAHSITLTLAVLDVLNPPSRWVESAVAASVVFAAVNNLVPMVRERWRLTFLFGLVHGFGFAAALKDLGLGGSGLAAPLVGFNLGVELGQLLLVALFLPLAWRLRGTWFYQQVLLRGGSVVIALLALIWLIERAGDVVILGF